MFFPLARIWQRYHRLRPVQLLDDRTDLVVEGFFRSGNTYLAHAIQFASDDRLRIAFHSHAAATVKRAARCGIPTLVLIRHPADAIVSNALKHDYVPMRQSLRAYCNFYRHILPWRDRFVTVRFEDATGNVNGVIARLNTHFGLQLPELSEDEAIQQALRQRVHQPQARHIASKPGKMDLPYPGKTPLKAKARTHLLDPAIQPLLERAEIVYEQFLAKTGAIGAVQESAGDQRSIGPQRHASSDEVLEAESEVTTECTADAARGSG